MFCFAQNEEVTVTLGAEAGDDGKKNGSCFVSVKGDYLEISVNGRLGVRAGDRDRLTVFYIFISQTLYCMEAKTQSGKEGNAYVPSVFCK